MYKRQPAWFLGKLVPVVGGPVFAILAGMLLTLLLKQKDQIQPCLLYTYHEGGDADAHLHALALWLIGVLIVSIHHPLGTPGDACHIPFMWTSSKATLGWRLRCGILL